MTQRLPGLYEPEEDRVIVGREPDLVHEIVGEGQCSEGAVPVAAVDDVVHVAEREIVYLAFGPERPSLSRHPDLL